MSKKRERKEKPEAAAPSPAKKSAGKHKVHISHADS